jgi:hypothetical protein
VLGGTSRYVLAQTKFFGIETAVLCFPVAHYIVCSCILLLPPPLPSLCSPLPLSPPPPLQFQPDNSQYVVDTASKRHVVDLGQSPPTDYTEGKNTLTYSIDAVNVSSLKRNVLLNVGLLKLSLNTESAELLEMRFVTQVGKGPNKTLTRLVFNPLEE